MEKKVVDRVRRVARRIGWRVEKARQRLHHNKRGGFRLLDENNIVVNGRDYDMSPERVIARYEDHLADTMQNFVAASDIKAELLQSVAGAHD